VRAGKKLPMGSVHSSGVRAPELTPETRLRLMGLSAREAEVCLLCARGFLIREIAPQLSIAGGTVKAHIARARYKLQCPSVRDLSALLLREGLITPEDLIDHHR